MDADRIRRVPWGGCGVCGPDAAWQGETCVAVCVDYTSVLRACCGGGGAVGREYCGTDVSIVLLLFCRFYLMGIAMLIRYLAIVSGLSIMLATSRCRHGYRLFGP